MKNMTTILFDLDGTLLDSADELGAALNALLERHGEPQQPFAKIRQVSSNGAPGLLGLGFGMQRDNPRFPDLRTEFLDIYQQNLGSTSRLFPAIPALLDALDARGYTWGIVTNKAGWLTEPLIKKLALDTRAACVISGDTTARAKPHPDPLLHACALLDASQEECLYVGDAERDIQAGRAAGMTTVAALYGYVNEGDDPSAWSADYYVETPKELHELILAD